MDFKKLAKDFAEDSSEVFSDIKKKAKSSMNPEKLKESIENVASSSDGNVIVNITEGVKQNISEQFDGLAKATSSAYNTLNNSVENAKNYTPEKAISGLFKSVWKEDEKIFGITVTRGQKVYYSFSLVSAAVLFLGMDLSLLFVSHEFENLKYSIFFGIWTLLYLLGIYILDKAVPKQFFEKKPKNIRITAMVIYCITMIGGVVVANVLPSAMYSMIAFGVHFVSFGWFTTVHIPDYKGLNFSYFTEKTPLLFSNFYNSVEK